MLVSVNLSEGTTPFAWLQDDPGDLHLIRLLNNRAWFRYSLFVGRILHHHIAAGDSIIARLCGEVCAEMNIDVPACGRDGLNSLKRGD